jgi:hypothetical protein
MAKKSKHQKKIEKLEREKLEIEVAQLKNTKNKKNTLLIVSQAIIPIVALLVAFFSTYLSVYKDSSENKLEGMSARNEAILQENQTILELIDLERRKDTLGLQIQGFEDEKNRLITQNDSTELLIDRKNQETILLNGKIVDLKTKRIQMQSDLDFASLNIHLQYYRKQLQPTSRAFENVLDQINQYPQFKYRVRDSLISFLRNPDNCLDQKGSYCLMGSIITRESFFDSLFISDLTEYIPGRLCISKGYELILSSEYWTNDQKKEICKALKPEFMSKRSSQKFLISKIILQILRSSSFKLDDVDEDLYWSYMEYNRKMVFEANDTYDIRVALYNLLEVSPPVLISALCNPKFESRCEKHNILKKDRKHLLNQYNAMERSQTFKDFDSDETEVRNYLSRKYMKHKDEMDYWVTVDFERFRNNKGAYLKVVEQGTL